MPMELLLEIFLCSCIRKPNIGMSLLALPSIVVEHAQNSSRSPITGAAPRFNLSCIPQSTTMGTSAQIRWNEKADLSAGGDTLPMRNALEVQSKGDRP